MAPLAGPYILFISGINRLDIGSNTGRFYCEMRSMDDTSLTDVSQPWAAYRLWVILLQQPLAET